MNLSLFFLGSWINLRWGRLADRGMESSIKSKSIMIILGLINAWFTKSELDVYEYHLCNSDFELMSCVLNFTHDSERTAINFTARMHNWSQISNGLEAWTLVGLVKKCIQPFPDHSHPYENALTWHFLYIFPWIH